MGVTSFTRSHERKSRGFVWVRPNHAGIIANLSKPLWASDLLSVGIHYFAGVVDDAEEVLEKHKLSTQCTLQTDQPLSFLQIFCANILTWKASFSSSPLSGETVKVPQIIYQR